MSGFGGLVAGSGGDVFAPAHLIAAAEDRAGPIPLDPLAAEGLAVLCADLRAQAGTMTFAGRKLLQAALVETLVKRRALADASALPPDPILIVAPFRSGTTLLHRLMAADPRLRAPLTYEVSLAPVPGNPDPRIAKVAKTLLRNARTSPDLPRLHPVGATLPEECFGLLEPSFLSSSFLFWAPVKGYMDWLAARPAADWAAAYEVHARGLAGLGPAPRWLLKSPMYLWGLGALLARYPGAPVIRLIRDPAASRASFRRLVVAHHRLYLADPDDARAGRFAEAALRQGLALAEPAFRALAPARLIEIDFDSLVADPVATLRGLWPRLGLGDDPEALARLRAAANC